MFAQRPGLDAVPWTKTTGIRPRRYGSTNASGLPTVPPSRSPMRKPVSSHPHTFDSAEAVGQRGCRLDLERHALTVDVDALRLEGVEHLQRRLDVAVESCALASSMRRSAVTGAEAA